MSKRPPKYRTNVLFDMLSFWHTSRRTTGNTLVGYVDHAVVDHVEIANDLLAVIDKLGPQVRDIVKTGVTQKR